MKIFIDCSGSTGGQVTYWNRVKEIINSNPDASFYLWDDKCRKYTYKQAITHANKLQGIGGTTPIVFVEYIKSSDSILIVTDGQISDSDVQNCDRKLESMALTDVSVEMISTGGIVNLSIAAPFSRNCKNVRLVCDGEVIHNGNTSGSVDLSIYQSDPEKFIADYESIYGKITMKTMGKRDDNLRNQLLDLQKNLLREIANRKFDEIVYQNMREKLQQGHFSDAIDIVNNIIKTADNSISIKIESFIQTLCKQAEGNNGYSFNLLQPNRVVRSNILSDTNISDVPINDEYTGNFECPISLDMDQPVLFVSSSDIPLLNNIEKNKLEEIINNPLTFLLDSELCKKFTDRIDHPIGLNAAIEISKHNMVSPITRRSIVGCLSFNSEKTHEKATVYTLAKILFGNKLVGNVDMWLIVTYNILKKITYIQENIPLMNLIESYIVDRLRRTRTNITLSGLPIEPTIKAPTDIAIWYCIVSPILYKDLVEDGARNRLRSMTQIAPYLMDILQLLKYPFDLKFTKKRLELYHAFALMQNMLKNNIDVKSRIRSLYQNCIYKENGEFAFFDGPVSNPCYIFCDFNTKLSNNSLLGDVQSPLFNLTSEEIYGLFLLLDKSKVNSSIMIPYDFVGTSLPKPDRNYTYKIYDHILDQALVSSMDKINYDKSYEKLDTSPVICPETLRPYTFDITSKKHWSECATELHGLLPKQLSVYNYFIEYVVENNSYPESKEDFMIWMYKCQVNRLDGNSTNTLPFHTKYFVDCLYNRYEVVIGKNFEKMNASDFIKIVKISVDKKIRISMEK